MQPDGDREGDGRRRGVCEGAAPYSSFHLGLCYHENALPGAACGKLQRPRAEERSGQGQGKMREGR